MYYVDCAGVDLATGRTLYEMNPSSPDFHIYDKHNNFVFNKDYYNSQLAAAATAGALVEIDGKHYTTIAAYAGRKPMGTALPTVYGSFGTGVSWKGINLGLLFTYSLGGKSYDSNYASLMSVSNNASAIHTDNLKAWNGKPAGTADHIQGTVNIDGKDYPVMIGNAGDIAPDGIPQLNITDNGYNNAVSSRFLTGNDYISLKNLNISYDFPSGWVSALRMQNLNLSFAVDNVFIATRRKGFNPQYAFNGGQGAYFVPTRTFSFALTMKF